VTCSKPADLRGPTPGHSPAAASDRLSIINMLAPASRIVVSIVWVEWRIARVFGKHRPNRTVAHLLTR